MLLALQGVYSREELEGEFCLRHRLWVQIYAPLNVLLHVSIHIEIHTYTQHLMFIYPTIIVQLFVDTCVGYITIICYCLHFGLPLITSPKFENFGAVMFLVPPPPPHANACTGHNFVTNTPIKFIFAISILYQNARKACGVSNRVINSSINFIFGIELAIDNT